MSGSERTRGSQIWGSQGAPPGQQPPLPGLRDTPVLKWVLLPLSVRVCACVCVRVHMGMRVGASAENKTGGRERPRSWGCKSRRQESGVPHLHPGSESKLCAGPQMPGCRSWWCGESRDWGHCGNCGPAPLLLRGLLVVLPEGRPPSLPVRTRVRSELWVCVTYKYIFNSVSCPGGCRRGLPSLSRCSRALPGQSENQCQLSFKSRSLLLVHTREGNI